MAVCNDSYMDALARIAQLEAERRWIPVGERLPEQHTEVLGIMGKGHKQIVVYDGLHWGDPGDPFAIGYNIRFWMPLPTPPEDVN